MVPNFAKSIKMCNWISNLKPMQTGKCKCSTFLSQSRILKIGRQYRIRFYANRTHTQKKTEQKMSKGEKNGNINKWCASTGSVFYCYTQVRFVYTSPERTSVFCQWHAAPSLYWRLSNN